MVASRAYNVIRILLEFLVGSRPARPTWKKIAAASTTPTARPRASKILAIRRTVPHD